MKVTYFFMSTAPTAAHFLHTKIDHHESNLYFTSTAPTAPTAAHFLHTELDFQEKSYFWLLLRPIHQNKGNFDFYSAYSAYCVASPTVLIESIS